MDFEDLYQKIIRSYLTNQPLQPQEREKIFSLFLSEVSTLKKAALLTLLTEKMPHRTPAESYSFYQSIMEFAKPFDPYRYEQNTLPKTMAAESGHPPIPTPLIDTCGTGGSCIPTLNVSTIIAFALATIHKSNPKQNAWHVIKHGNRSVSGKCGSMDFLNQLEINYAPNTNSKSFSQYNLAFLFAPDYHPIFARVSELRRSLAFPTIFNWIGPLANPAPLHWQLIGIANSMLVIPTQKLLRRLHRKRAVIVHGEEGLDEVSLTKKTQIILIEKNSETNSEKKSIKRIENIPVQKSMIHPEDFGVTPCPHEKYQGGTPQENLNISRAILQGEPTYSVDHCNHLAINLAVALIFLCKMFSEENKKEAFLFSWELLRSGKIWSFIQEYKESTQQIATLTTPNTKKTKK